MRHTTPAEPSEPIEPAEPLSQTIKGRPAHGLTLNSSKNVSPRNEVKRFFTFSMFQ